MCYQFSAGGFRTGAYADGIWTDSVSGTVTTTGYQGTTTAGTSAYLMTAFTGNRTYQLSDTNYGSGVQSLPVTLGNLNAANEAFNTTFGGLFSGGVGYTNIGAYYASNVFYPTYPYLDSQGFFVQATSAVEIAQTGAASTSYTGAVRVFMTASSILTEWILDVPAGGYYVNRDGFMVATPLATFASTGLNLTTLGHAAVRGVLWDGQELQLLLLPRLLVGARQPGVSSPPTAPSPPRGLSCATAARRCCCSPSAACERCRTRRQAPPPHRTSLRSSTRATTPPTWTTSSTPPRPSWTATASSSNSTRPPSSSTTPRSATWPRVGGGTYRGDISLYSTNYVAALGGATASYTEGIYSGGYTGLSATPVSSFQYAVFNASVPVLSTCQVSNTGVAPPPTLTSYSFCYFKGGAYGQALNYTAAINGSTVSFNTYPIAPLPVQPHRGRHHRRLLHSYLRHPWCRSPRLRRLHHVRRPHLRRLRRPRPPPTPSPARRPTTTAAVKGSTTASSAASTSWSTPPSPYIDTEGLLYQYAGGPAYMIFGQVPDAPIDHLLAGNFTAGQGYIDEEIIEVVYTPQTNQIWFVYHPEYYGAMMVVADGGVSGNAGTVAQQYCAAPVTMTFNFCYTIANTLATSPYGPWSIYVSGTLIVNTSWTTGEYSTSANPGYIVVGATGTRTIVTQGKTTTVSITGVAPLNSYNFNDNVLRLGTPALDTALHGVTFTLSGPAVLP